jgi:hypothetical protein
VAAGSHGTDNAVVSLQRRGGWHGRRRAVPDIVTPTPHEEKIAEIARRRRRYLAIMLPCLALVVFGFWVPAPVPVRVVALIVASVMPPIAAIVGNARMR